MRRSKRFLVSVIALFVFCAACLPSSYSLALVIEGGSEGDFIDIEDIPWEDDTGTEDTGPVLEVPPLVTTDENGKALPHQLGMDEYTDQSDIVIYEEVARNDQLVLYADMNKGLFALKEIATDHIWYSTPHDFLLDEISAGAGRAALNSQIAIEYVWREGESSTISTTTLTSYIDCVPNNGVTVQKLENGVRVDYYFKEVDITVPVTYEITGGDFTASILMNEIKEGETAFLVNISLLPAFAAATEAIEGYAFVPDGSGALVDYKEHLVMSNSTLVMPVYGADKAVMVERENVVTRQVHMPVFGMVHGANAIMGIITEGDGAASLSVTYRNEFSAYTSIGTVAHYRTYDHISMFNNAGNDKQDISKASRLTYSDDRFTVVYRNLTGEQASYVGMANAYRDYLIAEKGLQKHTAEPSLHVNMIGMVDITASFFGIKYTSKKKLTTYKQAEEMVAALQDAAIDQLSVRYSGWTNFGLQNSKMVKNANPLWRLGGKSSWNSLVDSLQNANAAFYPELDLMQFRKSGNGVSLKQDAIHTLFDKTSYQYRYMRTVYSKVPGETAAVLLKPSKLQEVSEKLLSSKTLQAIGSVGLSKLGYLHYSDLKEADGLYRNEFTDVVTGILAQYREQGLQIGLDTANVYAAPYADVIWNMPLYSSGYDIYVTDVPFYQLVLHGYVTLTTPAVVQSEEPRVTVLKAVETGSELLYNGIYEDADILADTQYDDLYGSTYTLWIDQARALYGELMPYFEAISDQEITAHTELADKVFCTEFANGVKAIVNYSDTDAVLAEGTCTAKGYLIVFGAEGGR